MSGLNKKGPAGKGAKAGGQRGSCVGAKPKARPYNGIGEGMGRRIGMKLRSNKLNKSK